jgi:hypothetical protein
MGYSLRRPTALWRTGSVDGFAGPVHVSMNDYLVHRRRDIPRVVREAFHLATTGRPGDEAPTEPRVWVVRDTGLEPVAVRTGLSDGTTVAIVGGDLVEGDEVVTGMSGVATGTSQTPSTSPLLPAGRRGGGAGQARPATSGGTR